MQAIKTYFASISAVVSSVIVDLENIDADTAVEDAAAHPAPIGTSEPTDTASLAAMRAERRGYQPVTPTPAEVAALDKQRTGYVSTFDASKAANAETVRAENDALVAQGTTESELEQERIDRQVAQAGYREPGTARDVYGNQTGTNTDRRTGYSESHAATLARAIASLKRVTAQLNTMESASNYETMVNIAVQSNPKVRLANTVE